jgi:hypothetical protein
MSRVWPVALVVAMLASGSSRAVSSLAANRQRPGVSSCGSPRLPVARAKFTGRFFPASLVGLWAPPKDARCIYLLPPGKPLRALWALKTNELLRSLQWAPDGSAFAIVVKERHGGWWVHLVGRDGKLRRRYSARGSAFVADDRLVLLRSGGVYLAQPSGRLRKLASVARLEQRAGFPSTFASINEGVATNGIGYGGGRVALLWWGRTHNVVLVVSTTGSIQRASPVYGEGSERGYYVGGYAWSRDGHRLFEMPSVPWRGPGFKDHDHCLDVWSAGAGFRRLWCLRNLPRRLQFHFDKLAWSPRGQRAILNNGTVVDHAGTVIGRATGYNGAFSIHWSRD